MKEQKPTKKEAREWLRGLFEKYRRVPQLQKKTFQDLYPKIDSEKALPATSELTRSEVGKLAFPLSARTCFEATQKWHNHELYMKMATLKGKSTEAVDSELADQGEEVEREPARQRRVAYLDGKGNISSPGQTGCPFLLFWVSQAFSKMQAFKNQYFALRNVVYENSTPEEREELNVKLDELAEELEAVAHEIREFRTPKAIRADKRVARIPARRRAQVAESQAVV